MNHDVLNWLNVADKFAADGNPKGMRACAQELWNMDAESMDGAAVMAEADRKRQALDPGDAYYHTLTRLLKKARGWMGGR